MAGRLCWPNIVTDIKRTLEFAAISWANAHYLRSFQHSRRHRSGFETGAVLS